MLGSRSTAARVTVGAISLSSSSHFALKPYSNCINPVALPPGFDRLLTMPEPTGSGTITKTIGTGRTADGQNDVGCERGQFCSLSPQDVGIALAQAIVDPDVATLTPAQLLQPLHEGGDARFGLRVVRAYEQQETDAPCG